MSQHTAIEPEDNRLVKGNHDFASITRLITDIPQQRTPLWWYVAFGISTLLLGLMLGMIMWLIWEGIGVWGLNNTVGWAWDITNFVWWVGIGHAGTLISAILFLFRQYLQH